ncbi:invasion gene expression up-regulator, SirB [Salinisphaera orenii MK-B5]|uniref:Invasion gene expression up-regulator, SirB n=1 Tax=Salinisphaera orenii MK-B5 TaxID=856730 RepID=A0A423PNV9_9GAMM|nr:SirB2 family protein [Salinisphaera orenii]ROO27263.1 invasion gene expression up-regulator, SirB [Salinisphaera orenii MK-B5]
MSLYPILKTLHVGAVALSCALFVTRAKWMTAADGRLQRRWIRVLPHAVDTVLLASALGLLWVLRLNPAHQPWLLAKFAALAAYILLGTIGLKRGATRAIRLVACLAAVPVFGYIVAVAVAHDPRGPLALLAVAAGGS